jgi:hypothetical protein
MGAYRSSRTQVFVERQKGMLASTMPLVEAEKQRRKTREQVEELQAKIKEYHRLIQVTRDNIWELQRNERRLVRTEDKSRARYFKCSTPDCRGFVHKEQTKCSVCEQETCLTCLCQKQPLEHTCKEDDVATAETIRKSTKSCPGCHTLIQRSIGCDQMFCTVCHIAFSYRTGEVCRGAIHNPHYYELQQRLNRQPVQREPGDVPCGGFPDLYGRLIDDEQLANLRSRIRLCNHIIHVELPNLRGETDFNRWNRIRFIMNEMDEKQFSTQSSRKAMDAKVNQHYSDILRAFIDSSQDVFNRIDATCPPLTYPIIQDKRRLEPKKDVTSFLKELETIVAYTNEASKEIGTKYKRSYFHVPEEYHTMYTNFEWVSHKK